MMQQQTKPPALENLWPPYCPTQAAPWDLRRVVHMHRATGFAATWEEVQRDLKDGPEASINRLLSGQARAQSVHEAFERTARSLADAAVASGDPHRLKAWWVYRMLYGPDSLTEQLTLVWHNHFATSNLKVNDLVAMRRQNETFRRLARAPFGALLWGALTDPALLVFLDAPTNRKGAPNENLARELMELFTLGIGHYTEQDVKEGARALTGWTVVDGKFCEDLEEHDRGEKTFLELHGLWRTKNVLRILLDHPATAERLAWRLCNFLIGDADVDPPAMKALAVGLQERNKEWVDPWEPGRNLEVGWAVETVLRSERFFSAGNLGRRILGPVEYVVGSARVLELLPSTLALADWAARLGQDLFYPPNVGGWPGGRTWIGPREMIGRAKFAYELVEGKLPGQPEPFDAFAFAKRHGHGPTVEHHVEFFADLLLGGAPDRHWVKWVAEAARAGGIAVHEASRRAVAFILACPEAQLF